jgi:hypothetical protein
MSETAQTGEIFVCAACGKTSNTREPTVDNGGWDTACMAHAVLCYKKKNEAGQWVASHRIERR